MIHAYRSKRLLTGLTVASAAFLMTAGTSFSAGSDTGSAPKPTKTTTQCTDGKVWDEKTKKCVNPKQGALDDDTLYDAARELAYAGQYDNAIRVLEAASNPQDPRILNYMGYANRKAGRMELGMSYYRQALAIDPDLVLARSYMGQALLEQGDMEGAMQQLAEIRNRRGTDNYPYQALLKSFGETQYN